MQSFIHKRSVIAITLSLITILASAQIKLLDPTGDQIAIPKADITASFTPDTFQASGAGFLEVTIVIPSGYHQILQEEYFNFEVSPEKGFAFGDIAYPKGKTADGVTSYYGSVTLERPVKVAPDAAIGSRSFTVTTVTQLCAESGECFFPETATSTVSLTITGQKTDMFAILWYLLLAFAGGILLNLMPCVLPVLSIKALSLVRQSGEDKAKIFTHGILYSAGIISSLVALAAVTVILKLSGEYVGWGFQFQNPLFVITLLAVIVVFALSLFDVFVVNPPPVILHKKKRSQANAMSGATSGERTPSASSGYGGSFSSGIFTVLLATPCTAPFLGVALGFAFTQEPGVIFLIFIAVGIGLALPFLLLSVWPSFLKKIPRAGAWMNVFREVMGFLLLATTVWLLSVLGYQVGQDKLTLVLVFLASLSFAAWLYGRAQKSSFAVKPKTLVKAAALVLALSSAVFIYANFGIDANGSRTSAVESNRSGWGTFSEEALDEARAEGVPVFLAFGAKWCLTCQTNEAVTLESRDVKKLFEEKKVKVLYGDFTNKDLLVSKWLSRLGRAGVPVYALYIPGSADPVLFPEIITSQMLIDAFPKNR